MLRLYNFLNGVGGAVRVCRRWASILCHPFGGDLLFACRSDAARTVSVVKSNHMAMADDPWPIGSIPTGRHFRIPAIIFLPRLPTSTKTVQRISRLLLPDFEPQYCAVTRFPKCITVGVQGLGVGIVVPVAACLHYCRVASVIVQARLAIIS